MIDVLNTVIEIIIYCFSMFVGIWFIFSALEPKFGFKKSILIFMPILSVFMIALSISKSLFDIDLVMNVKSIVIFVSTILITFVFTKSKISKKIIVYLIFTGLGIVADLLGVMAIYLVTGKAATDFAQNTHELTVSIIVSTIIDTILVYVAGMLWKKFVSKESLSSYNKKSIVIVLECEAVLFFSVVFLFPELFVEHSLVIVMVLVVFWVSMNVMLFIGFKEEKEKLLINQKLENLNYQRELELDYYSKLKENIDTIRKYRHDINNMLTVTEQLIKNPDTRKNAEELFEKIKNTYGRSNLYYYCDNPILNTIIYENSKKAEKTKIVFEIKTVFPAESNIDDADLCALAANLIDNAFEAAENTDERKVGLSIWSDSGYYFFKVQNSCKSLDINFEDNKMKTTKSHGDHGLGTQIIDDIAKKYNGNVLRTNESDEFVSVITLIKE